MTGVTNCRERLMVDYGHTPIIDDGIAVDLRETSDEEIEELFRCSINQGKLWHN